MQRIFAAIVALKPMRWLPQTPVVTSTTHFRRAKGLLLLTSLCLLWGVTGCSEEKSRVVMFNQEEAVGQFVRQLSQYQLSDEALRLKTTSFKASLNKATRDYAAKHHVTVMRHQHILAGAKDVTQEIDALIAEHMRGAP